MNRARSVMVTTPVVDEPDAPLTALFDLGLDLIFGFCLIVGLVDVDGPAPDWSLVGDFGADGPGILADCPEEWSVDERETLSADASQPRFESSMSEEVKLLLELFLFNFLLKSNK